MINYPASIVQVNCLLPLKKWRILNLSNLYELTSYQAKYDAFIKMIRNLEKKNLVKSFRDPTTRRKYIYLTREGDKELGGELKNPEVSIDTLAHDSKVSEIVLELFKSRLCEGFALEHDHKVEGINPDAVLYGEKKGQKTQIALELEITRKSRGNFLPKIEQYVTSSKYDLVLYYFSKRGVFNSYQKLIKEEFGDEVNGRIAYLLDENLWSQELNLNTVETIYKGQRRSIHELLKSN